MAYHPACNNPCKHYGSLKSRLESKMPERMGDEHDPKKAELSIAGALNLLCGYCIGHNLPEYNIKVSKIEESITSGGAVSIPDGVEADIAAFRKSRGILKEHIVVLETLAATL